MEPSRFAILGTGFWAGFQLAAWRELPAARCMALYNRTPAKARDLAARFEVPNVYADAAELLRREALDFVDIISSPDTHRRFVELAAEHRVPVICQKPLAENLADAEAMLAACRDAGVPLLVHENWRWQRPLRALRQVLESGAIGRAFRARVDFICSFPVFDNQPALRQLPQFILADLGSHLLDIPRFLFGEARNVYCRTHSVNPSIRGEDVATVVLAMAGGPTVTVNLSYASRTELERFPETRVFIEGTAGSVELAPDHWIRVTDAAGTTAQRHPPPTYAWADPRYALVHASIVDCNADLLRALRGGGGAETTGEDNLRTLQLVFAAYESARGGKVVALA